ncbi:MAG: PcfJ domain-containing protein [Bacillota bacterium]|nr:PcfJ domain-containing protein [Bacillota bacterium]
MHEDYMQHFSSEISEEIENYAIEEPLKFSRYIFTRREGKHQYGYCTHCGNEYKTVGLKHNEEAECPYCKSMCTVKSSGRGRKYMVDEALFEFYDKSLINPNIITAQEIRVTKDYRNSYKDPRTSYTIFARFIFEMGNSVMIERDCWGNGFHKTKSVHKNVIGYLIKLPYTFSRASIKKAVKDTPFRYSTWDSYTKSQSSMVKFFDLYSKYPGIEYLTKEGFEGLVIDKLQGAGTFSAVNWRANSIFKMLRVGKENLRELKNCKGKDDSLFLRLYQISQKDKSNLLVEDIDEIRDSWGMYFRELQSVHKYISLRKMAKYINQQYNKYKKQFYTKGSVLTTWRDYLADCETLEMNLKDEHVLYPKNLHVAHQSTISQVKVKANEKFNIEINKRAKNLEKYTFEYDELIIRAIGSVEELIKEGEVLHHCVGRYAERYAKGESRIFAIRKKDAIDKPYFTLELNGKDVIVQVHGKNNCNPGEDVKRFIEAFKSIKLIKKKDKVNIAISA